MGSETAAVQGESGGWFSWARDAFNYARDPIGTIEEKVQAEVAKPDGNPAKMIFGHLGRRLGEQGVARVAEITNDQNFMGALNDAIRKDPNLVRRALTEARSNGSGNTEFNGAKVIDALGSESNRITATQVLRYATANPEDPNKPNDPMRGFSYLKRVANAARQAGTPEGRADLRNALADADIKNPQLEVTSVFDKLFAGFKGKNFGQIMEGLFDPQLWNNLSDALKTTGPQGQVLAGLASNIGTSIGVMTPSNRQDRQTAVTMVSGLKNMFHAGTGAADLELQRAAAQAYQPGRSRRADAEPLSAEPRRQTASLGPVGLRGSESDVQVAEANQPTARFNLAALGLTPNPRDMAATAEYDQRMQPAARAPQNAFAIG